VIHRHRLPLRFILLALAATLAAGARAADQVLTLEEAIRLALLNNQRIKVSEFSPQIARANVLAAYGRFDPAITFNRSYGESETPGLITPPSIRPVTQTDNYSLTLDGVLPWGLAYSVGTTAVNERGTFNAFTDSYSTFGGVTVTQPLLRGFGFGANLADLRIAKANRGISDWQLRQTVIDTVTNVIFTYNNLQEARANVRIARKSRDLAAQLLAENEKRHGVGAISDAEVTQARARVANRDESVLSAERSVHDLENIFRQLLGETKFPLDGPPVPTAELTPAADLAVDLASDLKAAYDLRPDYQARRLGLVIDRANSSYASNRLLPQLDFVGSYGYGGLDPNFPASRAQVRAEDARVYSIGMVVRVPLAFAEGRGRARAAKLTLRQSEADLVRLEGDIAVSVTAAVGQIETTRQRVAVTRQAYALQQQVLEDEQKKYKAGTSSTFFVLQEQENLAFVQSSYAHALADQRRAQANYDREIGRTLERFHLTIAKN
jgi:outer membrane protein TolC